MGLIVPHALSTYLAVPEIVVILKVELHTGICALFKENRDKIKNTIENIC
jgi:hypothetical protein